MIVKDFTDPATMFDADDVESMARFHNENDGSGGLSAALIEAGYPGDDVEEVARRLCRFVDTLDNSADGRSPAQHRVVKSDVTTLAGRIATDINGARRAMRRRR